LSCQIADLGQGVGSAKHVGRRRSSRRQCHVRREVRSARPM